MKHTNQGQSKGAFTRNIKTTFSKEQLRSAAYQQACTEHSPLHDKQLRPYFGAAT